MFTHLHEFIYLYGKTEICLYIGIFSELATLMLLLVTWLNEGLLQIEIFHENLYFPLCRALTPVVFYRRIVTIKDSPVLNNCVFD